MKKKQKLLIIVFFVFVICVLVVGGLVAFWGKKNSSNWNMASSELFPRMEIRLNNNDLGTIEQDKTIKYPGNTVSFFINGAERTFEDVEIKGHGNSTWESDKKAYQLRFPERVNLLGANGVRRWLLIANRFDASQLRNDTALYLGKMLDMEYAVSGDFTELNIDGDYRGLYYLVPKININKNSVDLRSPMGILVELDNLHSEEDDCYYSGEGMCLIVGDAVNKDNTQMAMSDFIKDFNELEAATRNRDFDRITELVDVESFAKYFLLSEFTVNPDSYTSSWYMYKDGTNDKIHAGPGWDFDFAFGNRNWIWNVDEDYYSPELDMVRETDAFGGMFVFDGVIMEREPNLTISRLMIRMMKIPQFKDEVRRVFAERMAGRKMELISHIAKQADRIYLAVQRDSGRWEKVDYVGDVQYLLDWVNRRYEHFEDTYGNEGEALPEFL